MSVIAKAEETVIGTTPKVIEALGRIKFLLVVIPIVCVAIGIVSQGITSERNIGSTTFKMGTFATPANPDPVLLANETQVRARLRNFGKELAETDYPKSLLITAIIDSDVVVVTGTAKGPELTKMYLHDLVQKELDFQNGRLEKLQAVQSERKASLESTLEDLLMRSENLKQAMQSDPNPVALMAMQQGLDNAGARISSIKQELSTLDLLNASDLFIDTSQFVRPPFIVASSDWYRPLIFGALGLAVGLGLTLLIAIIAIVRAFTKEKDGDDKDNRKTSIEENSANKENADEPGT
jgi:hypothetical protein